MVFSGRENRDYPRLITESFAHEKSPRPQRLSAHVVPVQHTKVGRFASHQRATGFDVRRAAHLLTLWL
jgi:hypothetical protein